MPGPAAATAAVAADALRVVLFGLPRAGKSSLLGALGQSTRTQPELLDGRIRDSKQQLIEQAAEVYDQAPRRTAAEIVPHLFEFRADDGEPTPAVLFDCDGEVVNQLLASRSAPSIGSPAGTLAGEIVQANALVLVIDASSPFERIEREFDEFGRFLRLLQADRGRRTEVAGLPVFLVLSKCDLLAEPGDSMADWVERIEDRKREVEEHFEEFLREGSRRGPAFGRIDVHVWDTAIRRPALRSSPAKPREPYHVAELFRQVLDVADRFRGRRTKSSRRLLWTAGGASGFLALLLALAAGFLTGNGVPDELQQRAEDLLLLDRPTAVERLRGPESGLRDRLTELGEVRNDPSFESLPGRTRGLIRDRFDELGEYLAYFEQLRKEPTPADEIRVEAIEELRKTLHSSLALPRPEWVETDAGRLHAERVEEADALLTAARKLTETFHDQARQARDLAHFTRHRGATAGTGIDWRTWVDDVDFLLDRAKDAPIRENDPLPNVAGLSYGTAYRLDQVIDARVDWERRRRELLRVRDVSAALGLIGPVADRPAVLLIPRRGFTLANADERLRELMRAYPAYRTDFARADLPDALLPELAREARTSYEHLLMPGREAVLQRLRSAGTDNDETLTRWKPVRDWLENPAELAAWRVLADVLLQLAEPGATLPIPALREFLDRPSFSLQIHQATLDIPEDLENRPAIGTALVIQQGRGGGTAFRLAMDGEGERDARDRLWRYVFKAPAGGEVRFQPGDSFSASLPLRDDWSLVWDRSRSALYRFECLRLPPVLWQAGTERSSARPANRVRLTLRPSTGVSPIPDLLPDVTLP